MTFQYEDLSAKTVIERKAIARTRWNSLPAVVKDTFDNAPKRAMYEVLRSLGVAAEPTRAVEWAYAGADNSLVVSIWHDQIESEPDGTLRYVIPPSKWRGTGVQSGRAIRLGELLEDSIGKSVKVMLLRHEWDNKDTQFAKVVAADIKRWRVEKVEEDVFVLRR